MANILHGGGAAAGEQPDLPHGRGAAGATGDAGAAARGRKGARSTVRARWPEGRRIRGDGERSGTAKMPNEKGGIPIEMEKRGG